MRRTRPARPARMLEACRVSCASLLVSLPQLAAASEPGTMPLAAPLMKVTLGLLAVLALLFFLSRLLSRYGGLGLAANPRFKVLASLPVGNRERIVLMQAGERQLVIGVAPGRVSALHVLEEPLEMETRASPGDHGAHRHWLARTLAGGRG